MKLEYHMSHEMAWIPVVVACEKLGNVWGRFTDMKGRGGVMCGVPQIFRTFSHPSDDCDW